jgi:hypothetical protein
MSAAILLECERLVAQGHQWAALRWTLSAGSLFSALVYALAVSPPRPLVLLAGGLVIGALVGCGDQTF